MDICVLNPYFYPYFGGTEKVLFEVYRRLAKNNKITVVTSEVGSKPGKETIEGIDIIRLKTKQYALPYLPLPLAEMKGLNEAIEKTEADICHINNRFQYFRSTIKSIKLYRKKLVLTIHNSLPKGIDPITDFGGLVYDVFWGRSIMASADLITAVSKSALETTVPKRMHSKARVIFNGIDYRLFEPKPNNEKSEMIRRTLEFEDGIMLISNGRLIGQKGHEYAIRAIRELEKEGILANLLIIGRGPMEKKLKQLAAKLGIGNRVKIINGIAENELPYYYNAADIFVFPSLYEPAGMAMLEALACGIPTIATAIGGIPETLRGYGEYIKVKDYKSIANAVVKVSSNIDTYRKLALDCRANVIMKEHDWDLIAKEYERSFKSISE